MYTVTDTTVYLTDIIPQSLLYSQYFTVQQTVKVNLRAWRGMRSRRLRAADPPSSPQRQETQLDEQDAPQSRWQFPAFSAQKDRGCFMCVICSPCHSLWHNLTTMKRPKNKIKHTRWGDLSSILWKILCKNDPGRYGSSDWPHVDECLVHDNTIHHSSGCLYDMYRFICDISCGPTYYYPEHVSKPWCLAHTSNVLIVWFPATKLHHFSCLCICCSLFSFPAAFIEFWVHQPNRWISPFPFCARVLSNLRMSVI